MARYQLFRAARWAVVLTLPGLIGCASEQVTRGVNWPENDETAVATYAYANSDSLAPARAVLVSHNSAKPGRSGRRAVSRGYAGWYPDAINGRRIPGGSKCIAWVQRLGIRFSVPDKKAWMSTPIEVNGPIGGITYSGEGKRSVVLDCRLVLALDWAARALRPLGVTAIEHIGAYSVRNTRSGRLSLHARGLALDIGAVRVGDQWFRVSRDYQRGIGMKCSARPPVVNAVACQLRALNLFRELITPDDDGDHWNHLHIGLEWSGQSHVSQLRL